MNSCTGLCCFAPQLASVGTCALNIAPTASVCGGGVGTASCGMAQVTVTAAKTSVLPWVIGIGAGLWLLSRLKKR
jgi:hypothetical protein